MKSTGNKKNSMAAYVEVKFHLLLTYCINLVFYLLKKSSGETVKSHGVISRLLEVRTMLETLGNFF